MPNIECAPSVNTPTLWWFQEICSYTTINDIKKFFRLTWPFISLQRSKSSFILSPLAYLTYVIKRASSALSVALYDCKQFIFFSTSCSSNHLLYLRFGRTQCYWTMGCLKAVPHCSPPAEKWPHQLLLEELHFLKLCGTFCTVQFCKNFVWCEKRCCYISLDLHFCSLISLHLQTKYLWGLLLCLYDCFLDATLICSVTCCQQKEFSANLMLRSFLLLIQTRANLRD